MDIRIQRDQAVWERETFTLKVRDDFNPGNLDHRNEIELQLDHEACEAADYSVAPLTHIDSISTETTVIMPDGEKVDL